MTKLKICGIRSKEEIQQLATLDIDYFGCIFADSPRKVNLELAKEISQIVHQHGKKVVGVFVNEDIETIKKIREYCNLDIIQLHGNENPEYCKSLGGNIWKVFQIKDKLPDVSEYDKVVDLVLFDTKGEAHGGNGIKFDWEILKNLPYDFILAGGLSIVNIKNALTYNPKILDVNSKVEINNRKDINLVKEVITQLKGE